jgi:hypothetical protein
MRFAGKAMTLQDFGALGDLIGGVAVVVTLFYLALETRRSANATKGGVYQQYRAQTLSVQSLFADGEMRRVYLKGRESLEALDESEGPMFSMAVTLLVNNHETVFHLRRLDVVDQDMVTDVPINDLFRHAGVREWWRRRGHSLYGPRFVDFVEELPMMKNDHSS